MEPVTQTRWRPLIVLAGLVLLASACARSGSESNATPDSPSTEATGDGRAGNSTDRQGGAADYDADPVASALRDDRDNPAFPDPLVDPSEIVAVLSPDAIPAVDEPQFVPVDEIDFLDPQEAVIVIEVDDEVKGYPVQIMTWHEIVNDEIGGRPVTVTYCPLCNSTLAFERQFGDRVLDFGTSGSLYQSALVMYDRQTESLWAHFTGTGIVGHYAGAVLESVPAQMLSFEEFKARHPDALVLTRDTGVARDYGVNPYIGYDDPSGQPFGNFFDGPVDDRLEAKTRVVGFLLDGEAYALASEVSDSTTVTPVPLGDETVVVVHQPGLASALDRGSVAAGRDVGQTGVFVARDESGRTLTFGVDASGAVVDDETGSSWSITGTAVDGPLAGQRLTPVGHLNTFWFAWSAYHPDTAVVES